MRKRVLGILFLCILAVFSCGKNDDFSSFQPSSGEGGSVSPGRSTGEAPRRVFIYVSAGYNSLSSYLDDNLTALESGKLPAGKAWDQDVLLVLSRKPVSRGDYSTPNPTVLFRLYADPSGKPVRDTLKAWEPSTPLCTPDLFHEALQYATDRFPSQGYGIIFSSHALGWLPPRYEGTGSNISTRSIGQDKGGPNGSYELSLREFVDALPCRMEYVLFDCCLMGCVEVAWELKDKADFVGFAPTEILAQGFDYRKAAEHLLKSVPDPEAVCRDYFAQYGPDGDATITLVDTRKMGDLAAVCKSLFEKYRMQIRAVSPSAVQRYFRPSATPNCVFFYDLEDVLLHAGIDAGEKAQLSAALSKAIVYKAASSHFLSIPIQHYSGLSLYLPQTGDTALDTYYKNTLNWNTVTQLIL